MTPDAPRTEAVHRHRYGLVPVWTEDGSRIDSWWWCTEHRPGEWVRIEDDPDAAEAIPGSREAALANDSPPFRNDSPATPADSLDALRAAAETLADEAARAVTEPRRFHENEDGRQQRLGHALTAVRAALRTGQRSPRNDEPEPQP